MGRRRRDQANFKLPEEPKEKRVRKYRDDFPEIAYSLCLVGYTNEDLARYFEVSIATISYWMREHEEFNKKVNAAKDIADAKVAKSLFERACGYTRFEKKLIRNDDGSETEITLEKHYPADVLAIKIWLHNRQPKFWRDSSVVIEGEVVHEHKHIGLSETDKFLNEIVRESTQGTPKKPVSH